MAATTPPADTGLKRSTIGIICGLILVLFLTPIVLNIRDHLTRPPVVIPDEQLVGLELLAQKFVGPRYFQPEAVAGGPTASPDKYYITVAAAQSQVPGIAAARKLDADAVAKLNAIIAKISEPPPSRVTGQTSVNTLRLNLALDALR